MPVKVFSARLRDGAPVPDEGVTLPEGAKVSVIADDDSAVFETTPEEESGLLDAIADLEQGETVRADVLLDRLFP
jgi:hypothetical protein